MFKQTACVIFGCGAHAATGHGPIVLPPRMPRAAAALCDTQPSQRAALQHAGPILTLLFARLSPAMLSPVGGTRCLRPGPTAPPRAARKEGLGLGAAGQLGTRGSRGVGRRLAAIIKCGVCRARPARAAGSRRCSTSSASAPTGVCFLVPMVVVPISRSSRLSSFPLASAPSPRQTAPRSLRHRQSAAYIARSAASHRRASPRPGRCCLTPGSSWAVSRTLPAATPGANWFWVLGAARWRAGCVGTRGDALPLRGVIGGASGRNRGPAAASCERERAAIDIGTHRDLL